MPGSSYGHMFRVTTAGESHGPANVVIVDGCPPGLALSADDLRGDLERRRPGQSRITTQRDEPDQAEIVSGVFEGRTTGTPIAIVIANRDQRSRDYRAIAGVYRPGHADYTFDAKFGVGHRDDRGGGRSSARETVARVAAGAIARKWLAELGVQVVGYVRQVGRIVGVIGNPSAVTREMVERLADGSANIVRCPDAAAAAAMVTAIEDARREGDSLGGVAEIVATGVPAGLGEPVFDKLKADLAKAIMSLPAVTAFEYGAGTAAAVCRGSEYNDPFVKVADGPPVVIATVGNAHGGMLGGISSGMPLVLRATVKPTSSLPREQATVNNRGEATTIRTLGRHDPCLLPRFVPMAEAMVLLTLADHWLRWRAQCPQSVERAVSVPPQACPPGRPLPAR